MPTLDHLKQTLELYFQAVDSQKSAQPLDLTQPVLALEKLSQEPHPSWHPQLRHYMESRSYRKAWTWLQGSLPEKGSCSKPAP
ncbi:MAG: hypothetical protein HC904_01910 [Blastochloris sp.]|nr:hypothetical protein [Blastochloris sp.]